MNVYLVRGDTFNGTRYVLFADFFSLNVVSITTLAKTAAAAAAAAAAAESLWQSFTHHNHQQQARNK